MRNDKFIRYIRVDFKFEFLDCVRRKNGDFVISGFVISEHCSIQFTVTFPGLKIVRFYIGIKL